MKANPKSPELVPIVIRQGSVSASIYPTVNRIYRVDPVTGQRTLKSEHPQFTLTYYSGSQRVKRKFTDLAAARSEAELAVVNIANGETEALKLNGTDRADYFRATQRLRQFRPDADLNLAIADYVSAARRLPGDTTLKDCVDFYLKRHPSNLPPKTVREAVDELVATKRAARKSDIYIKDLSGRLGDFADAFSVRLSSVTGRQVEDYIRGLGGAGRTQNNRRRLIGTLFKFAIRRGYLPKDHDELSAVERADDDSGEIEIFTPGEMRKLFTACAATVIERGKERTRAGLIPALAIAAFAGLRSAEVKRLDWSEVHLTGSEKFIELKASKAKTASRRIVPIVDNLAAWLTPHVQEFGPVVPCERLDKQLFERIGPQAGMEWRRNALRHSFISYRLAVVKDIGQVSLEAGNSAQMIFKHYRQLVTEEQAKDWFCIMPPKPAENVVTLPAAAA